VHESNEFHCCAVREPRASHRGKPGAGKLGDFFLFSHIPLETDARSTSACTRSDCGSAGGERVPPSSTIFLFGRLRDGGIYGGSNRWRGNARSPGADCTRAGCAWTSAMRTSRCDPSPASRDDSRLNNGLHICFAGHTIFSTSPASHEVYLRAATRTRLGRFFSPLCAIFFFFPACFRELVRKRGLAEGRFRRPRRRLITRNHQQINRENDDIADFIRRQLLSLGEDDRRDVGNSKREYA